MRWLTLLISLGMVLDGTARARSRDFSAPPAPTEPVEPPLPRSGPMYASFGIGLDYFAARWRELNDALEGKSDSAGLALRARVGTAFRGRTALFLDAYARAAVVPPLLPVALAGIGVGGSVYLSPEGPWHVDLSLRRAWGARGTESGVLYTPPPITHFGEIWLAEVGIGRSYRRGRIDRGWTLAVLGGLLRPEGSSGWAAGVSLIYAWSRS